MRERDGAGEESAGKGGAGDSGRSGSARSTCSVNGYTWAEERLNAVTHGIGLVAAALSAPLLIWLAVGTADAWRITGVIIFSATLLLLYTVSTLYHAARDERRKALLRLCDHCAVYLLIAGTYTPFMLTLRGRCGWALLATVWLLSVVGIFFKLHCLDRFPRLSTALYVAMGWLIVVAAGPLIRLVGPGPALLLAGGGLAYTAGLVFFHNRREYAHAIWHLFVLAGSICHGVAVALSVQQV